MEIHSAAPEMRPQSLAFRRKTGAGGGGVSKMQLKPPAKEFRNARGFSRMRAFPSADFQKSDNLPKSRRLAMALPFCLKRARLQRLSFPKTRAYSAKCGFEKERGFARKAPRRFAAIVRPDFCPLFRARNILPSPSPPPLLSLPIFQTPRRCGALFRGASIWKSVS